MEPKEKAVANDSQDLQEDVALASDTTIPEDEMIDADNDDEQDED